MNLKINLIVTKTTKMQLTKFSLITLLALVGTAFAQVDDNAVARPGDDRVPAPAVPAPIVPSPSGTVDDSGHNHTGVDDHGHNSTAAGLPTSTSVPVNGAMKNGMGALGLASVFAFFMF